MQRILWISNIRQEKSLLQLLAGLWDHRHFTHTPQLWPLYPNLSWASIHHDAKTWLHPLLQAPELDTSHQTARQEHSPTCQQTGCLKPCKAHRHLKMHTCCGPAYQKEKTQHHPPGCIHHPSHSEDYTSSWTKLTQEGTDNRSTRNCDHRQ